MNLGGIKKILLWGVIGFLSLSALFAVITILAGEFGDTQIKVLLTTLTISGASVCGMACAAFTEKRGLPALGGLGGLCALAAGTLAIAGMWLEVNENTYWKCTVTLIIFSAAFAHAFLAFIPSLARTYQWSQAGVVIFVAILAALIDYALWREVNDTGFYRVMAVVAILLVLFTLVVPICAKLAPARASVSEILALRRVDDGIYVDETGQRYRVEREAIG